MRMVDLNDPAIRDGLKRRFVFWPGPVPFQCDDDPKLFAQWVLRLGGDNVGMVIVDSVKDMLSNPNDNDAGIGFNDAMQRVIGEGVEFGCCHHNRKAQQQNSKPRNLSDVYGSRFLVAGLGSVCNIWADNSYDSLRELTQLKAPYGNPIRPLEYRDELLSGTSKAAADWRDLIVSKLAGAGVDGLTDAEIVYGVFESTAKDAGYEANRQKITRQLARWVKDGCAYERIGSERGKIWRLKSDDYPTARKPNRQALDKRTKAQRELAEIDARLKDLDDGTE